MLNQFSRTELLLGREALEHLEKTHVAIFGIGGVGGYVAEALVRSGVGSFTLVDDDKICLTNLNRQIIATRQTIGKYKTEVMKERILSINPQAQVNVYNCFFLPENAGDFDFTRYRNRKDPDHHAGKGSRRSGDQLYGSWKQAESHRAVH